MNRLKELRQKAGLNMAQTAKALGVIYQTYVNWEKGIRKPTKDTLIKIAEYYGTTVDYIIGASSTRFTELPKNVIPIPITKNVPLIGDIACGKPILAQENIESLIKVDADSPADFALRCKGDSMINARLYDGDIVYIRQQPTVEDGDIASVLIEDEATLKKFYRIHDKIVLRAANPIYDDIIINIDDPTNIQILGKAIAFVSAL